ncbi:hypothetical protein L1887_61060 [Cichorium endivia]|nr:hypothetical protein L1887_61060 [Cichorium endivia]
MTRLANRGQLSQRDVHPDPSTAEPLLPASAPLPHEATRLHKPPRWWSGTTSPSSTLGDASGQREPNSWAKVNLHYHGADTRDVAAYGSYFQGRLAWAAGVAMAVWVSGGISGGHCNPSVTVALALFRGFPRRKVIPFVVAQTLGATAASLLVYANNFTNIARFQGGAARTVKGLGSTAPFFFTLPAPELSYASAFFSEFLATAVLLFVVFALADTANLKPPKGTQPFAMFIVLLGIGASLGYNTGYAINGARDTGPRIALWLVGYGSEVWTHDAWYWAWNRGSAVSWVERSEASSSRTLTVEHPNASDTQPHDVGILRLRPEPRSRPGVDQTSSTASASTRRVVWTEETVDNEGLGRKKSKICCIYHKPKAFDESSDESSSASDSSESDSDSDAASSDSDNGPALSKAAKEKLKQRTKHRHHHQHAEGCTHAKSRSSTTTITQQQPDQDQNARSDSEHAPADNFRPNAYERGTR